jgi:spermidine synthase
LASAADDRRALPLAAALMLASGFAGLAYQIAWTQQAAVWLGQETLAVLAVMTAFFGGLAAGALALGRRIERSPRPWRWYAGCELLIAAWGVLLAFAQQPLSRALLMAIGPDAGPARHAALAFAGTFILLLPATAAMGATLPAMERLLAARDGTRRHLPALYAANTAGALLGVLAAAFWLVPGLGLARTALACVLLNLLCAALAATALRGSAGAGTVPTLREPEAAAASPPRTPEARRLALLLAATGLLGIADEVLVVRALSQVAQNTVYTFALLLAVYLAGSAAGAAIWAAWQRRRAPSPAALGVLLSLLALAVLLGTAALWSAPALLKAWAPPGAGMAAALAAEAGLAALAFGPATLVMGALFAALALRARAAGIAFGQSLGLNTAGAAAAPWLFGLLLVPAAGLKAALLVLVAAYLVLAAAWQRRAPPALWALGGATAALALWAPPLALVELAPGAAIVERLEGAGATVSVVQQPDGSRTLHIDNRQPEGSSATRYADARQALLPLLLHPAPRRALFLGLGTGVTARAAAQDPALQVDVAELLPEVIRASRHFETTADAAAAGRLHVKAVDARRYVRSAPARYDLIVADNVHPARSGSALLWTREHFQAVRARLAEGGLFCQWLPLHQMDLASLRLLLRTYRSVFPGAGALLATHSLDTPVLGLVARADDRPLDLASLRRRLAAAPPTLDLAGHGLGDELAVLGTLVAGPQALAQWADGDGDDHGINTDDRPLLAYRAPRATYAPEALPHQRLLALLAALPPGSAADAVDLHGDRALAPRWLAYTRARDRYLQAGQTVRPTSDVRRMLDQVAEPLLAVLAISPDFAPARLPLQRMAEALAAQDAAAAQALRAALSRPTPPAVGP